MPALAETEGPGVFPPVMCHRCAMAYKSYLPGRVAGLAPWSDRDALDAIMAGWVLDPATQRWWCWLCHHAKHV